LTKQEGAIAPLFVRAPEAAQLLGISKRLFYRLAQEPTFPRPVRLTDGGHARWRPADLEAWAMARLDPPKGPEVLD
jgi:predicted DNA-binding transcriptional regulator AlpA